MDDEVFWAMMSIYLVIMVWVFVVFGLAMMG